MDDRLFDFYKKYSDYLDRYSKKFSNVPIEDIKDCISEAFLKIHSSKPEYINENYILTVIDSTIIDYIRSNNSKFEESYKNINIGYEDKNKHDIGAIINYVKDKHTNTYYQIFILYFIEGYKYYEIAEILDIPKGTVANNIRVLRKTLQIEFYDLYYC